MELMVLTVRCQGAALMTGSPGHDAQLQQQLQQHVELHHQYQSAGQPPPPSTSSSSPWRTLSELTELPPDDMDDGSLPPPPHPGVMATPFQQLVGSFGGAGGPVGAVPGDDDEAAAINVDEPFHRRDALDVQTPVHQTRSAHLLYAPQRLNASA